MNGSGKIVRLLASFAIIGWVLLGMMIPGSTLFAASYAVIVTGMGGSPENEEEFQRLALETKRLLVERGIPLQNIVMIEGEDTRERIIENIKIAKSEDDEFWLVLFGHSGKSRGGLPAFQLKGPRLTAADLEQALNANPARQYVFIGTNNSGGFLPGLQNPRRMVVAATKAGQTDQPRYPDAWVKALAENPKASFPRVAARASALVEEIYKRSQFAQVEHARLADPVTGKILEPPFGVNLEVGPEQAPAERETPKLLSASDIKVEIKDPNAMWEHHGPTEETQQLIATARNVPNPDGYSSLVLEQRVGFTVENDRTTDHFTFYRVFIAKEDAVGHWANHSLPQSPPYITTKLEVARVILPDGSSVAFNPVKLPDATDCSAGSCGGAQAMVFLPKVQSGCVIEVGYRTRRLLNTSLPEVTEMLEIQRGAPVLFTKIEVRVPEKKAFRVVLRNHATEPRVTAESSRRVYRWELGPLPAVEALPFDPPETLWTVGLGISSFASWDDFSDWYRRIIRGSDVIDEKVRQTALELTAATTTRREKIQRLFEFVSGFRYIDMGVGLHAFRPRNPGEVLAKRYGDCKDKANLLIAMLRCVDIDANFVLVNRGGTTDIDFPSWQFNHAICRVPKLPDAPGGEASSDESDSIDLWLDATDSITPFGFIAVGNAGRPGLVFGKDKAEFITISTSQGDVSILSDVWDIHQTPEGWQGSFQRNVTGLAELEVRRLFWGNSPLQRKWRIYQMVSALWPGSDCAKVKVSDMNGLGSPVDLTAQVASTDARLPVANFPWMNDFNAPERDRPLWLNDGQPFTVIQTVRLHYTERVPLPLPEPLSIEVAGHILNITWRRLDDKTAERIARVESKQPNISVAHYQELRRALSQWNRALATQ